MSIFGGGKGKSGVTATRINNIQLQTSSYGMGLPLQYGANRGSGNLIWYANFQAIPHTEKVKAGKGMGGSYKNTTYTYTAAVIMSLGEGPLVAVGRVWKDKDETTLEKLGLTFFSGTHRQAPWEFATGFNSPEQFAIEILLGLKNRVYDPSTGELITEYPAYINQTLGYDTTAYLASANYDLGDSASIPNHSFEILGFHGFSEDIWDANPRDIIEDFLTDEGHGVGFSLDQLGNWDQYSDYCVASGIFISPRVEDIQEASEYLGTWLTITNTDPLWSEGKLKLLPRGDKTVTGNGATYTPDLTPIYDITVYDFGESGDQPLKIIRRTPADAFNRISIEVGNRTNSYTPELITAEDQDAIETYGLRAADKVDYHEITSPDVGTVVAQLLLNRALYCRNEYETRLSARFDLLEPGDLITLTYEPMGMDRVLVRILQMDEEDEGWTVRCEDMLVGIAESPMYEHYSGLHYAPSYNDVPNNPADPHIFELPGDPTTTGLAVGIAAGRFSGDILYGGSYVWISTDDESYSMVDILEGSSIYGKLLGNITEASTELTVQLESGGQLQTVSADAADNDVSLITIGEEYISYEVVTLVGTDTYELSGLRRARQGTTVASHSIGDYVSRIDTGIARIENMDTELIGSTIYIKLLPYNIYKSGSKGLEDVDPYLYEVTGYMEAISAKGVLNAIADDNMLSGPEKVEVIREWQDRVNEKPTLDARAINLGITTQKTAYDNAYDDLETYLNGLNPDWDDTSIATPIDRSEWNLLWNTLFDKREDLSDEIVNKARAWSNIVDDNGHKPEDDATYGAPGPSPVGGMTASQVVTDLTNNTTGLANEQAINTTWRSSTDTQIGVNGTVIRVQMDEVGVKTEDNIMYITEQKSLNPETGVAKYLLSVVSGGHIVGLEAAAGGNIDQLSFMASRFLFVDNSGGNAREAANYEDGVWKMPAIEVDTLKENTAIIPVRASQSTPLSGTSSSTSSPITATQSAVVATIEMTTAGWIEIDCTAKQGFSATTGRPWQFTVEVNGVALDDEECNNPSGSVPGDSISVKGMYYADGAGDYTIEVLWNGNTGVTLETRILFIKGFKFTAG